MARPKSKRRGRPPTGHDPIRGVRMSDALVEKIEKWRYRQLDRPNLTISGAMRDLITLALMDRGIIKQDDELWQGF